MSKRVCLMIQKSREAILWAFARERRRLTTLIIAAILLVLFAGLYAMDLYLMNRYAELESPAILDRNGNLLTLEPNPDGAYGRYQDAYPPHVLDLLIQKEDRFFYFHPGVNPLSTLRAIFRYFTLRPTGGASTITQQLVKNLMGNSLDRTLPHKLEETFGTFALELFNRKSTILNMYANSVYMGNQVQGLDAASSLYFKKKLEDLDDTKLIMLLATISSPSVQNPWRDENGRASRNLAIRLGIPFDPKKAIVTDEHAYAPPRNFELAAMHVYCDTTCTTTLDGPLTERIRSILQNRVLMAWNTGARSGAVVVIKEPENEILAMVGTPDFTSLKEGQQIDMALQPRPIGSTAKPLIYLEGFTKGLRPYTLVDDREYKYPIGTGYPLYPKNYDGQYRGWVTLHSALSNSLNVPTVKVLEYVGLNNFYDFLQQRLGFMPLRDLDEYQFGIALGALEMDPLTLAQYLTIFPKEGVLEPLTLFRAGTTTRTIATPMSHISSAQNVADPAMTQLVTKVLNDRLTGVEQFGLSSSLNLSQSNYAVKTGTSENFHDSWTIGYTPDYVVVVWFGDPENSALLHVTGQSGAGTIWHDTMELLMNSEYNAKTPLDFSQVQAVPVGSSIDYGLIGDTVAEHRNLLPDAAIIRAPHDGDRILFAANTSIPLVSDESVEWSVNGESLGKGTRIAYTPYSPGTYTIRALTQNGTSQSITIRVTATR